MLRKVYFLFIFTRKSKEHAYRWRKKEPIVSEIAFKGSTFSNPPENPKEMTSFHYLKMFWNNEICDHLAYHTNLYSTQQTCKSRETTHQEIETFFSIQMTTILVKVSQYKMYWSKEFKYDPIASAMTLKRYETLQRFCSCK